MPFGDVRVVGSRLLRLAFILVWQREGSTMFPTQCGRASHAWSSRRAIQQPSNPPPKKQAEIVPHSHHATSIVSTSKAKPLADI